MLTPAALLTGNQYKFPVTGARLATPTAADVTGAAANSSHAHQGGTYPPTDPTTAARPRAVDPFSRGVEAMMRGPAALQAEEMRPRSYSSGTSATAADNYNWNRKRQLEQVP